MSISTIIGVYWDYIGIRSPTLPEASVSGGVALLVGDHALSINGGTPVYTQKTNLQSPITSLDEEFLISSSSCTSGLGGL